MSVFWAQGPPRDNISRAVSGIPSKNHNFDWTSFFIECLGSLGGWQFWWFSMFFASFFEHGFCIDFSLILAWISTSFWSFFDDFSIRALTLQNLQTLWPLQRFALERFYRFRKNLFFDDFHDLSRYQFWHWFLDEFWHRFATKGSNVFEAPFGITFHDFGLFEDWSFCNWFLRSALARRPAYTLRMYTLIRMLAPCLASALSRYHPGWDPTPRTPPPGTPPLTPQGPPHHPPTPPHITPPHPPLVRVEGYSKWMVIPSGWLFRVHGYPKGSKFDSNKQGRAQTQSMQKALTALVDHCTFCPVTTWRCLWGSPGAARNTPRVPRPPGGPRTPKSSPSAPKSTPRASMST